MNEKSFAAILFNAALCGLVLPHTNTSYGQTPTASTEHASEVTEMLASTPSDSAAAEASQETRFLRVHEEGGQPLSMDTAVVSYRSSEESGAQVDLIGAVHIGEADYYATLNRLFDQYDVLLYELVAPEGVVIPRGGPQPTGFNPVALLQGGAKNMLGLELQLERIDYTKPHFVRADLTPRQLARKMEERGDTPITLALDAFVEAMRQQNLAAQSAEAGGTENGLGEWARDQELSLADMLTNPLKMKRVLAAQFAATGSLDHALGNSLNQLLIVDRNAAAIKELQRQLALGKKKIGVFYGAAHLPDLEKQLKEGFGLQPVSEQWLVAWDLSEAEEPALGEAAELFLDLLNSIE